MSQRDNILRHLWDRLYHPVYQFTNDLHIMQYNARIKELRDEGFVIENITYKEMLQSEKTEVCRRMIKEPKDSLTFFKLITPTKNIDFQTLKLKLADNDQ